MTTETRVAAAPAENAYSKLMSSADPAVLEAARKIAEQSEAIRRLDEITNQVEAPYIGSFFSV